MMSNTENNDNEQKKKKQKHNPLNSSKPARPKGHAG